MPCGTLDDYTGQFSLRKIAGVLDDVLSALVYLEGARVVHHDVKPANVLVSATDTAKIGDFGLARLLQGAHQLSQIIRTVGA
jgi:serine/threonine protein kinase